MRPVVIAVAITGSVPRKHDNPAVPITVTEQIESTQEAFEAGASLVHLHVRGADESPSSNPELFARVQEGVRRLCPGMIIQFSTGGRGRDPGARGSALYLKPDMASLATGSVNFPTIVYENPAALVRNLATTMRECRVRPEIEIFDLSHIHAARRLVDEGLIDDRPHVQFVLGIENAMPPEERLLDIFVGEVKRVLPNATWTAAGIGRHQSTVIDWVLSRGGDAIRTGLEDNIRVTRDRLAGSNAELVEIAGGDDPLGRKHRPSAQITWRQVLDAHPEIIVLALCGYDVDLARRDYQLLRRFPGFDSLPAARSGKIYLVNATAYFARPGPRVVDSLEILAGILHPEEFPEFAPQNAEDQRVSLAPVA